MGGASTVLKSTPIGSCVVLMAWSASSRFGIMAHVMLPGCAPEFAPIPARYSINAIETLADMMAPHEALADTGVCLIGAANVLKKADDTICHSNIHSITRRLRQKAIPVHATLLGGHERRMACLYAREGRVTYTQGEAQEETLWQCVNRPGKSGTLEKGSINDTHTTPV